MMRIAIPIRIDPTIIMRLNTGVLNLSQMDADADFLRIAASTRDHDAFMEAFAFD